MSSELYNMDFINADGNYIHQTAIIGENVKLGFGNIIMPYAVIGSPGFIRETEKYKGKILIGNNNKIGCYTSIMFGKTGITSIGDNNSLMNYVNIGHNVIIGNKNEVGPGTIVCGYAKIGNDNKIKVNVNIRNRIKIGSGNLIGMGSNVVNNFGDNLKIYGNPAKEN